MFNRIEKEKINLVDIALRMNYSIDTRKGKSFKAKILKSSRREVFIYDNAEKGFYYQNQHDKSDKGSAFDFVMSELGCDFIRAKEYITANSSNSDCRIQTDITEPKKSHDDLLRMINMNHPITNSTILKNRGISIESLSLSLPLRNACIGKTSDMFIHSDLNGQFTGYEYISESSKGFGKNCSKSLFYLSKNGDESDAVIVVENAIEAYSIAELSKLRCSDNPLFIVSTGGRPSKAQATMIGQLCTNKKISALLAHDNDAGGDEQATVIADELSSRGVGYKRLRPTAKDWNDVLLSYSVRG